VVLGARLWLWLRESMVGVSLDRMEIAGGMGGGAAVALSRAAGDWEGVKATVFLISFWRVRVSDMECNSQLYIQ